MAIDNAEKQAVSIALMDDNQQQKKEKVDSYFHRHKKWCAKNYLIGFGLPILFIIVLIILILLFRESSRRCGIFDNPHRCEQMRNQSD